MFDFTKCVVVVVISIELFAVTQQPFVLIPRTSELTSVELRLTTNFTWWVFNEFLDLARL